MHQTCKCGSTDIEFQHPHSMLYHCVKTSVGLSKHVQRTAALHPPKPEAPWSVVLYFDEVFPGNALAYKNQRKLWAVYWTFREFGSAALCKEDRVDRCACLQMCMCARVHLSGHGYIVIQRCPCAL